MINEAVILHPGKEKPLRQRHHWIFSGAVRRLPEFEDGAILPVHDATGTHLGYGYFNRNSSIIGRMLSFDDTPALEALEANIRRALALRRNLLGTSTDAYRVVNGEGDGVPGLVVDRYGDVLVLQISTLGMDRLKPLVVNLLESLLAPRTILERSNLPSRKMEGLAPAEGILRGEDAASVEISENGLRFRVEFAHSQKTGFYLDQRENRSLVRSAAAGRRVLDAFCYTGGFTVAALAGGAASADSVDISENAVALARTNCILNGFGRPDLGFVAADVFEFLRGRDLSAYGFIILDPPAFAKRRGEVAGACRGYKDIHRLVFAKSPAEALILTFSCSYFVDEGLFRQVVFQGAAEAGRRVRIIQRHRQASDHPVNIYHPEGDYLKGFLLYVD
jgi:23S rRNA (cytosine1962-C5)-methyltransferase